ncbi:MAG: HD domain-containing phosphohydrolase [Thermodesulfobacteriota bacterium]
MNERILFVDDDAKILESFRRMFGRDHNLAFAEGGQAGLDILAAEGPFALVVSDIKMPGMDGIEFLTRVKEAYPDTVRMILTGYADQQNAIDAVNEGYIFRFLVKPCKKESLEKALRAGLEQHRLIQAGKEMYGIKRLKKAMQGILLGLTSLVEARDPYTAGHQRRVTDLSRRIGERMGLDAETLNGLCMASMVHDIGKVYVPAEFLNKPGRLSDAEFSIIKSHPQVGFDILDPIDFPWPLGQIVHQHHERLDGSGYPLGLAGEDILIEARIMAVADVVDAMASHRPYRASLGVEEALHEISSRRGVFYDARAVDACVALFTQEGYTLDMTGGAFEMVLLV